MANLLRPPAGGAGIGDFSLHDFAAKWMMQQDDIAEIGHYADENATLSAEDEGRTRMVCFGDSITAFWPLHDHDTAAVRFVNRGIPGQNSSQMLLRFIDDVVEIKPSTVAILAGTNDLRTYVGDPASVRVSAFARIMRNLTAMTDIARANGIRVVLSTLPPVGADSTTRLRDPEAIVAINTWIARFATTRGYAIADYHTALADGSGYLPISCSDDGVHPSPEGYARMWPELKKALNL